MDRSSTSHSEEISPNVSMDASSARAATFASDDVERAPVSGARFAPAPGALAADGELRAAALRAANRRVSRFQLGWLFEWMRVFPAAIALFFLLRAVLVEAYKIPSGSMEGTLLVGDFLLVNKLVYGATIPLTSLRLPAVRELRRGDVVVFEWPRDQSKNFVKRLVALPGDTVSMQQGVLMINGVEQDERYVVHTDPGMDPMAEDFRWQRSYLVRTASAAASTSANTSANPASATPIQPRSYQPSRNNWGPLVVPEGHFFALGDNRDNSLDSRYWGFVPDSLVRGTPMMVYYSYSPDSTTSAPWLTNIRWRRLGERIR